MSRKPARSVQVAIGVIERQGRVLISRRGGSDHLHGCWEFPGGKRRPGESWEACLKRELFEELGIAVAVTRELGLVRYRYPDRRVLLKVFRCRLQRGAPRARAGEAIRWVARRRLARYRFPPANQTLLRELTGGKTLSPSGLRLRRRRDIIGAS